MGIRHSPIEDGRDDGEVGQVGAAGGRVVGQQHIARTDIGAQGTHLGQTEDNSQLIHATHKMVQWNSKTGNRTHGRETQLRQGNRTHVCQSHAWFCRPAKVRLSKVKKE